IHACSDARARRSSASACSVGSCAGGKVGAWSIRRASRALCVSTATAGSSQEDPRRAPDAEQAAALAEERGAGVALAAVFAERPADDHAPPAFARRADNA